MRNKIKQLLKKEGGFTLVELLAVLAILALIVGIAIPMVGNVIGSSKTKAVAAQKELIIDAAILYETQEQKPAKNIKDLVSEGYLEDDDQYEGATITRTPATGGKTFTYEVDSLGETTENATKN